MWYSCINGGFSGVKVKLISILIFSPSIIKEPLKLFSGTNSFTPTILPAFVNN